MRGRRLQNETLVAVRQSDLWVVADDVLQVLEEPALEGRLAYYGFSAGAAFGPIFTAVEDRFAASVLLGGGLMDDLLPPDTSVTAFAPRSTVPTLMINGDDDFIVPYAAQRRFFDLLGTPSGDTRHARLAGGHIPSSRRELIDEIETWLDRYLGPVD